MTDLYLFNNRVYFKQIGLNQKLFAAISFQGQGEAGDSFWMASDVATVEQAVSDDRRYQLSPQQIALLNPNTRTAPVFRSARDAQITAQIYERVPVLMNETTGENPWGIRFMRMFDMSNDSGLFRTAAELEADGWTLHGNRYRKGTAEMLPLYEAKLMHQFDHRYATYDAAGNTRDMTSEEKADPHRLPLPRYWVAAGEVEDRLVQKDSRGLVTWEWSRDWLMGFRDITNATNERTFIASLAPRVAVGHKMPLMYVENADFPQVALGTFDSFVFDYVARQKAGGTSMTYHYVKQFPILPPSTYTPAYLAFITPRVLELTYTAHDLTDFARDLGYGGDPFTWDDERRFWLRAELDALYFILYGIERDDVAYIMDTFPIVRRKDEAAHGRYRTKEAILEVYDALGGLALTHLHAYRSRVPGGAVAGGWLPGRMEEFAPTAISPMVTKQEARDAITELLSQYPELASLEVQNDLYRHRAARSAQNRKEDWVQYIIEYMRE